MLFAWPWQENYENPRQVWGVVLYYAYVVGRPSNYSTFKQQFLLFVYTSSFGAAEQQAPFKNKHQ